MSDSGIGNNLSSYSRFERKAYNIRLSFVTTGTDSSVDKMNSPIFVTITDIALLLRIVKSNETKHYIKVVYSVIYNNFLSGSM